MFRLLCTAAFAFAPAAALAEETKGETPSGTWTHEAGGFDIQMAFAKDSLVITLMSGENGAVVTNSYTSDKDGTLKLKVTKVEEKGTFPGKPALGLEVSFKWKADDKKATLTDLKGDGTEEAKGILEGDYSPKKK